MYYYGGYSSGGCGCNNMSYAYPYYGGNYGGYGYNSAIILVLFILLVIIIGSRVVA